MTGTDSSQTGPRLVAGRYRLTEVLGRGGMGVVWRATDELIGRTVAVKELRVPHGLPTREQPAFGERALREARTAGRVRHPGVIAIHDLIPGTAQDNTVYVVMELVEAPSLATVLEEHGALPESRVARLGLRLLEALDAAHAIGLVHRDVKPSNILVLPDDQVKLVDFGIAHAVDDTRLTRTGVAGSTGYIAPELFEGHSPTPAVDLWSLGVTLHHAATGRSPFERGSTAATIRAILHDDPPPLDRHPSLAPVIEGLLARDPDRRMSSEEAIMGLRLTTASTRDTPLRAPQQETRRSAYGSGRATWEDRPTNVRRGTASPGSTSDSGTAQGYALRPATTVRHVNRLNIAALALLCTWAIWKLVHPELDVESIVSTVTYAGLACFIMWDVALAGWDGYSLSAEGITLMKSRVSGPTVTWRYVDEVVLASLPTHAGQGDRTAITLRLNTGTPAQLSRRLSIPNVAHTSAGSSLTWTVGEVKDGVDTLNAAFRSAAPLQVTVSSRLEPDSEDLRYHGRLHVWPLWMCLLLAVILAAV